MTMAPTNVKAYSQSIIVTRDPHPREKVVSTCSYNALNARYHNELLLEPRFEKLHELDSVSYDSYADRNAPRRHMVKDVAYVWRYRPTEFVQNIVVRDPEQPKRSYICQRLTRDTIDRHYRTGITITPPSGGGMGTGCGNRSPPLELFNETWTNGSGNNNNNDVDSCGSPRQCRGGRGRLIVSTDQNVTFISRLYYDMDKHTSSTVPSNP